MKAMSERMAMNAPLQGTAADLVKIAMIRADDALKEHKLENDAELLLQVHDELIFEVKNLESILEPMIDVVRVAMQSVAKGTKGEHIPLIVDVAKGSRWGSMK
jgi:DNA polymerase-1